MLTLFSVWAAVAKSYDSLLAARCLMGIATGSSETVSPDVVGEVFFVYERGRAMVSTIIGGLSQQSTDECRPYTLFSWLLVRW